MPKKMTIVTEDGTVIRVTDTEVLINNSIKATIPFSVVFSPSADSADYLQPSEDPQKGLSAVILKNGDVAYASSPIKEFSLDK